MMADAGNCRLSTYSQRQVRAHLRFHQGRQKTTDFRRRMLTGDQ